MALINLQDLSVAYGKARVLHHINLCVQPGERVALIGPSGAGKSTLLYQLHQHLAGQSAFIHQQYGLVPQLSVFHNIYIGRLAQHHVLYNVLNLIYPQAKEWREVAAITARLGLGDKLKCRVGALSGGQQQRVAIGRALYRGSAVILADEPVSSIDLHQGEQVLRDLTTTEQTVIMSLHSVDFARQFAQRIIGLRDGTLQFDCSPAALTEARIRDLYAPC